MPIWGEAFTVTNSVYQTLSQGLSKARWSQRLINRVELNRRSVVACVLAGRWRLQQTASRPSWGNVRFISHREICVL